MIATKILQAAVVAGLIGCPSVSSGQAADQVGLEFEYDTNRPGNDLGVESVDDVAACHAACGGNSLCRAWTFVGSQTQGEPGQCWLKDMAPPAQPEAGMVSGVKQNAMSDATWPMNGVVDTDSPLADVLVRVGDVDNFGFDWPADFTPFAGRSTPTHGYPWEPGADDAEGTDRIMVGSGYRGEPPYGQDGYTSTTGRPANAVRPIELSYALHGVTMRSAVLQLFVDDFQAPVFRTSYEVRLDGERIPLLETVVNTLEQTGPIGKLVSVEILPEHFHLLEDGNVAILFDDPATGAGDGFAIDFVQLLINPKELPFVGSIRGSVVEKESGAPLEGALVSSAVVDDETTPEGQYALSRVPAGLVVVQASKAGYESESVLVDLEADSTLEVDLALARRNEESDTIRRELDETGRAQLRGIYFDLDSATLKSESEATLFAVLAIIQDNPDTVYTIEGHTDAEGAQEYNVELSRQRAQAVVQWLLGRGVTAEQLDVQGYGESRPVADNGTAAGRALNRRVEIVQGQ